MPDRFSRPLAKSSLSKPIIVIKAGRTEAAARAASSHTGSLAGSDDALDAAFERCGVLRVNNIADVFYMVEVLSKQPRPRGPRLTILTNAGGPGVLATDSLIAAGGLLSELSPETIEELQHLPPRALEPWQSGRHHRRRGPGALRASAGNCRQRSGERRPVGDHVPAGPN